MLSTGMTDSARADGNPIFVGVISDAKQHDEKKIP